jgi:hypothetical protein
LVLPRLALVDELELFPNLRVRVGRSLPSLSGFLDLLDLLAQLLLLPNVAEDLIDFSDLLHLFRSLRITDPSLGQDQIVFALLLDLAFRVLRH